MNKLNMLNQSEAKLEEEILFTFAVVTDTHIKLEEGDESSAFRANQLANTRTRYLVEELKYLSLEFVVHLGDFVHPVPGLPTYEPAMEITKEIFGDLKFNIHGIPGNHDIGDKPSIWMPGPKVSNEGIELYERFWGKTFSSFDYKDIHFILINSPVLNSGLACEKEQQIWLEKDLSENDGKRIFMFTHYPLYLGNPEEEENYDNIIEPARSWLLSLIKKYNIEAVYAGHVHHFFYNKYEKTDQYILPSNTFYRHDYSELYQIEPTSDSEGGRDDVDKMGFFLVKVYKDKHVNHFIRTQGRTEEEFSQLTPNKKRITTYHMKENKQNPIGVYLRHSWAEKHGLAYANLDEFGRKAVRNDYPLMALWDLGIRKLRIPFSDLLDDVIRERIKTLKSLGHEFTVFTVGIPNDHVKRNLVHHKELVDVWELVMIEEEIEVGIPHILDVKTKAKLCTYVSKIETSAESGDGTRFNHFIRHGFKSAERDKIVGYLKGEGARDAIDGFVFRLDYQNSAIREIQQVNLLASDIQIKASLHVQMRGSDNPAFSYKDDPEIANRVAEIVAATIPTNNMEVFLDTFIDHDRGHFIRNGILDRRNNPRLAYHVLKNLFNFLVQNRKYKVINYSNLIFLLESSDQISILMLPKQNEILNINEIDLPKIKTDFHHINGSGNWINLKTGEIEKVNWKTEHSNENLKIKLDQIQENSCPMILVLESNNTPIRFEINKNQFVTHNNQ